MADTDREKEINVSSDPQAAASTENEAEDEDEIERLTEELDASKMQAKETNIVIAGVVNNHNHKKFAANKAVLSLNIPNSLFLLWNKINKLQCKLGIAETPLISLTTESLSNVLCLNAASTTLQQRLRIKKSKFLANYKKAGGSKQKKLLAKFSNMILLEGEVTPSNTQVPT